MQFIVEEHNLTTSDEIRYQMEYSFQRPHTNEARWVIVLNSNSAYERDAR